jgi:hypothetical protein
MHYSIHQHSKNPSFNGIVSMSFKSAAELGAGFTAESQAISSCAAAIMNLSDCIWKLSLADADEYCYLFSPICELLERWSSITSSAATIIRRIGEDFRDITERSIAFNRFVTAHREAMKARDATTDKLSEYEDHILLDSKRKDFNRAKADLALAKLKEGRKAALIRARDATQQLINERIKFSKFAFRRALEGFRRLAFVLGENKHEEVAVIAKLIEGMQRAREGESLSSTDIVLPEFRSPVSGFPVDTEPADDSHVMEADVSPQGLHATEVPSGEPSAVDQDVIQGQVPELVSSGLVDISQTVAEVESPEVVSLEHPDTCEDAPIGGEVGEVVSSEV